MIEHGVSAFLISPAYGDEAGIFERIGRAGIPAMQLLRLLDPRTGEFPFASPDYETGGRLATRHLAVLGARRIAFVGGLPDRPVTRERMTGYRKVMGEEGFDPVAFHGRPSRAFGREAALTIARRHPDLEAAICFSDLVALGMLSGFAEAGIRLGIDFRLVGFDDIEECALVWPQLSSVRCDVARFGRWSAEAMLAWLEDGSRPPEIHRAPVELVARRSSLGA
jgi:LacI family transcriptional regulator